VRGLELLAVVDHQLGPAHQRPGLWAVRAFADLAEADLLAEPLSEELFDL